MTLKIKEREFKKTYLAVVKNRPPQDAGELSDYMVKNESQNKSYIVSSSTKGAKLAQLRYRVIGSSESFYLLEVELITGRCVTLTLLFDRYGVSRSGICPS